MWAVDGSGWQHDVLIVTADDDRIEGDVLGRRLASERRTKVSLFQGLVTHDEMLRIAEGATALGAISIAPLMTDSSVIPTAGGASAARERALRRAVLLAAEASGRGRVPRLPTPQLFDHALDREGVRGATVLLFAEGGRPLTAALRGRPFSIAVFCPPAAGFSAAEAERAQARGAEVVDIPLGEDHHPGKRPSAVTATLAAVESVYRELEIAADTASRAG